MGQSPQWHQQPPELITLSSKQLWALADCLDSFFAAHPHALRRKMKDEDKEAEE